jgi:hypothetical protein
MINSNLWEPSVFLFLTVILQENPFHKYLCADYQLYEFAVNNYTDSFKNFLQESGLR